MRPVEGSSLPLATCSSVRARGSEGPGEGVGDGPLAETTELDTTVGLGKLGHCFPLGYHLLGRLTYQTPWRVCVPTQLTPILDQCIHPC